MPPRPSVRSRNPRHLNRPDFGARTNSDILVTAHHRNRVRGSFAIAARGRHSAGQIWDVYRANARYPAGCRTGSDVGSSTPPRARFRPFCARHFSSARHRLTNLLCLDLPSALRSAIIYVVLREPHPRIASRLSDCRRANGPCHAFSSRPQTRDCRLSSASHWDPRRGILRRPAAPLQHWRLIPTRRYPCKSHNSTTAGAAAYGSCLTFINQML
jgi:hypothetical protein